MELKRGYKQTEVGAIPSDWEVSIPERFGRTYGGLTGKSKHEFGRGSALYVTFVGIMENVVIDDMSFESVDVGVGESQNAVQRGDVLFTGSSETAEEVAMCALVIVEHPRLYLNSFCFGYRIDRQDALDGLFLTYLMRSPVGRKAIASLAQGSTRYNISKRALLLAPLPRPPIHEQRSIAAALSDVDVLIDGLDRLIAKKQDIKQAAMQQLLTGYKRLTGFNGAWEKRRVGEIGTTYGGLSGKTKADFGVGEARYVTFLNVLENVVVDPRRWEPVRVDLGERQNQVRRGDVLFNGTSETPDDLAMAAVTQEDEHNLFLNSFCFGFRVRDPNKYLPLFLAYYFRGPSGRHIMHSLAQGATRYNLSKSQFMALALSLPQNDEQEAIATVLSDMDAEIDAVEARRDKTRHLKQAMMYALLTGNTRLIQEEVAHG